MALERLDKMIAAQGSLSRADVKKLAAKGAVTVNGAVERRSDRKVDPDADTVCVQGKPLPLNRFGYLMLNKPKGVVSASRDSREKTVLDLVPRELLRRGMFPAGRLDKDTEGFVLITDDGAFAHRILSPKNHVPKVYLAGLDKPPLPDTASRFREGICLQDGQICQPALLEPGGMPNLVKVTICEGMYHQIKRMFAACGLHVLRLKRIQLGGLPLDPALLPGQCRSLSPQEVSAVSLDGGKPFEI